MSFAQEMKDFVAGYSAVADIGMKKDAAELDKKKVEADIAYQNSKLDLDRQELALKERSASTRAALGGGGGTVKPSEQRAQARYEWEKEDREAEKEAQDAENLADSLPDEGEDTYAPVGSYADGGVVGTPLETSPRPKARPSAIPTEAPAEAPVAKEPAKAPEAPVTPEGNAAPAGQPEAAPTSIFLEPSKEALGAVGESFLTDLSKKRSAIGEDGGEDKLPLSDYETIMKTVDPEGKLPEHLKTSAALGAAFKVIKDPQKKVKLAKGVLGSAMEQSQILGSLVPDALRSGNVNEACRLFNDACNKFPTGHQVVVTPIDQGFSYKVKDEAGKVVMDGNLTPEQLMQMSGQVADGSLFIREVYNYYSTNKKTGGNYTAALDGVTKAYNAATVALDEYNTLQDSDATDEEKKAAYTKVSKAREALTLAETDARKLGLQGAKPLTDRQIASDLRSARRVDSALGDLTPPPGMEQEAPAPAPAPAPAQGGKPAPAAVLESAKAAIAKGASREAVIKRLTDNGFSTEGL